AVHHFGAGVESDDVFRRNVTALCYAGDFLQHFRGVILDAGLELRGNGPHGRPVIARSPKGLAVDGKADFNAARRLLAILQPALERRPRYIDKRKMTHRCPFVPSLYSLASIAQGIAD